METITAYKLSNGTIVENKAEAFQKQNYLDFEGKIKDILSNKDYLENDKEKILSFMIENKKHLKIIFKNAE